MNENLKDTKLKKKSSGVITKKKSTQSDAKLLISNKKNKEIVIFKHCIERLRFFNNELFCLRKKHPFYIYKNIYL